jgi:hypothetical protein
MTTIATLGEFAYAIRLETAAAAAKHQLLLELAEGLVIQELGVLTEYPVSAKAVVLEAAARAYFNLIAAEQRDVVNPKTIQSFVYLTNEEINRLYGRTDRGPRFSFPGTWPYPDPVEAPTDPVSFGDVR